MNDFRQALEQKGVLFLDGATGTMLQKSGLPLGMSPERFCYDRRDILCNIHKEYIAAGADILTTCTFGANPYKLEQGLDLFDFNKQMVEVARQAASSCDRPIYIAGNVGPSGQFLAPLGDIEPNALIDAYCRQIKGLLAGGIDLLLIETQFDLAEARALVIAAKSLTDLPIVVSMTFEHGVCLTGSSPEIFAKTMDNLGVDVIGTNCSLGPDELAPVVQRLLQATNSYVLAEPNAGLPKLEHGTTVFPLQPVEYASKTALFAQAGCKILGGCCGTTPEHIATLKQAVQALDVSERIGHADLGLNLTTRTALVQIKQAAPFTLIGERINPTGKQKLTSELQNHVFSQACALADQQIAEGATVLDVNVGAPLVDEAVLLPALVKLLTARVQTPLALDSSNPLAIINALPYCPGSALVNSISGEHDSMELLGPICKKYGAPFILLPLQGKTLPLTAKARITILEGLLQKALALQIPRRLILVDILALAISSSPNAAKVCLEMLVFCKANGLASTIGLSNISFGLPARELLNSVFLSMAIALGLTSCIANPSAVRLKETLAATNLLQGYDPQAEHFISAYKDWQTGANTKISNSQPTTKAQNLYEAVLFGDKENVESFIDKELQENQEPFSLVQKILIPAITEVGTRYEKREYFLPQLIRAAETMQLGFAKLEPLIAKTKAQQDLPVIVMATVEGDIHDIGKNIVSLLLSNYGFKVVDLGKDVPASKIVYCAIEHNACIIGLSALMTTTMVKMEETIKLLKEKNLAIKVMVGGAALTQSFADKIGADAYCADAVSAVRAAKTLAGCA